MKYAAIDIGTNAVLLLIMEENGGVLRELLDISTITRLGQGLLSSKSLSPDAMSRTIDVLERYKKIIKEHDVREVLCFGTAAVREARNRKEFIEMTHSRTGLDVQVFSEYQEAYYTYLSVHEDRKIAGHELIIVDIGGGSTEIIEGDRDSFRDFVSVPVGTVKLTESFIRHDPPLPEELETLSAYVRDRLPKGLSTHSNATLVGMAGTMTTLAAMVLGLSDFDKQRIDTLAVPLEVLIEWIDRLGSLSIADRRRIPGMESGREDVLLSGLILMKVIMTELCSKKLIVSTAGARFGVIFETTKMAPG